VIIFCSEDIKIPLIKKSIVKKWITQVVKENSFKVGDINLVFCSDQYLLDLNIKYLNHNYFTDIITFNYSDYSKNIISGDLFISVDTVLKNSKEYGVLFNHELHRVMIHGILHLLGQDDQSETDFVIMKSKEDQYLSLLNQIF
jgi:rRNA maturation RNase YbeY